MRRPLNWLAIAASEPEDISQSFNLCHGRPPPKGPRGERIKQVHHRVRLAFNSGLTVDRRIEKPAMKIGWIVWWSSDGSNQLDLVDMQIPVKLLASIKFGFEVEVIEKSHTELMLSRIKLEGNLVVDRVAPTIWNGQLFKRPTVHADQHETRLRTRLITPGHNS